VELQFRAASGEALPFAQEDLAIDGHAVEARLYAEDPEKEFLPSTGKLWALEFPKGEGIRIDTGVQAHDEVTPYYDPMIAKVIAHGATRDAALTKLADALGKTIVAGPKTNVAFLKKLCEAEAFRAGQFDTGFIDRNLADLGAEPRQQDDVAVSVGAATLLVRETDRLRESARRRSGEPMSPWSMPDGFQMLGARQVGVPLRVDGDRVDARALFCSSSPGLAAVTVGDRDPWSDDRIDHEVEAPHGVYVFRNGRQTMVQPYDPFDVDLEHMDQGGSVKAPMHGKLIAVFVKAGDKVEKGQRLAIVEAMKMEHVLVAPTDGEVAEIAAEPGAQVAEGARLIGLKTEE